MTSFTDSEYNPRNAQHNRNWEIYHENSKQNSWYRVNFTEDEELKRLPKLHTSLPVQSEFSREFNNTATGMEMSLENVLKARHSCRNMKPEVLDFEVLNSLIFAGFGITRPNTKPRPLRTVPSGGKLFPLESYFYTAKCDGLPDGLFHIDLEMNEVQLIKKGLYESVLAQALAQHNLAYDASLIFFLTGIFERTTIKYGERGYRLVLLEAGHVAQNINLAAAALGLGSLNICAFYDRKIEDFLEIDGVNQSILYMVAIGKDQDASGK